MLENAQTDIARSLTLLTDVFKRTTYLATLFWLPQSAKDIPSIKLIQFFSAGTNHVAKHPIYTDSKIPLCSANGVHGPQIAEWVIMMDLVHSHRLPRLLDLQKEKKWNQKEGMEVSDRVGKRVGILGYGSIGRQGKGAYLLHCILPAPRRSGKSPSSHALRISSHPYCNTALDSRGDFLRTSPHNCTVILRVGVCTLEELLPYPEFYAVLRHQHQEPIAIHRRHENPRNSRQRRAMSFMQVHESFKAAHATLGILHLRHIANLVISTACCQLRAIKAQITER